MNRGSYYYFEEDYISAIANYDTALLQSPYYAKAYLFRGSAYYNLNRFEDALKDFKFSFNLNPEYAFSNVLWVYGAIKNLKKEGETALEIILNASNKIISKKENYSEYAVLFANYYLGNISEDDLTLKTTEKDKEFEKYKKFQVYYHIGQNYLLKRKKEKAKEMFIMADKLYMPDNMIDPSDRPLDEWLQNL